MIVESPGFFDLQVNGFAGTDFNDPLLTVDQIHAASIALRRTGVTRYLPTLITSSFETFRSCATQLMASKDEAIAGIHLEGPYISSRDGARGAHPAQHCLAPSIEDFKRRQDAAEGQVILVTLAPELDGALKLIEHLVESGVRVAIGHTEATAAQIKDAVVAGATLSTHLGNGCVGVLPRHPNHIWEQLANDDLLMSLIVDGHHLPPSTVKVMVRAKTPARTILVTDAIAAAACEPGAYQLGGLTVHLDEEGRVAEPGAAHLAGSALSLGRAIENTLRFTGLKLEEVLPMASTTPAAFVGQSTVGTVMAEWNEQELRFSIVDVRAECE